MSSNDGGRASLASLFCQPDPPDHKCIPRLDRHEVLLRPDSPHFKWYRLPYVLRRAQANAGIGYTNHCLCCMYAYPGAMPLVLSKKENRNDN
jgi:hypothetical protein